MFKKNKTKKKEANQQAADEFFGKSDKATDDEQWINEDDFEGQLSVDVYDEKDNIVIKSTIAGVKPEDIDISINNEMVTIKGKREQCENITEENYYYQECYWGGFSRSIILPVEVQANKVDASLKNGVLKVILPKAKKEKQISIKVNSED
ncbi:MAG: Hsp20/alpha crystallin family protein [Candidatus Komeilibacteria bacterium]